MSTADQKSRSRRSWPRIPYDEAIAKYGSDKPDLRNPIEMADVTEHFRGSGFKIFAGMIEKDPKVRVWAIPAKGGGSRAFCDRMNSWAQSEGQPGLAYIFYRENEAAGPVGKNLGPERSDAIAKQLGLKEGDAVFFAAGNHSCLPLGETAIHTDLLTASGKLVQHQWLRIMDGRAVGNFRLSDTLASGTYRLRAYTDEDDGQHRPAFERSIAVYNILQGSVPKSVDTAQKLVDVQILPEGGRWLVGLPARLGIKIIQPDGHGLLMPGRIVNEEGTEIVQFSTNKLGMGSVVMTPQKGRKYYAEVLHTNQQQLVPILPAEQEGLTLSVDAVSDTNRLAIIIIGTSRPT